MNATTPPGRGGLDFPSHVLVTTRIFCRRFMVSSSTCPSCSSPSRGPEGDKGRLAHLTILTFLLTILILPFPLLRLPFLNKLSTLGIFYHMYTPPNHMHTPPHHMRTSPHHIHAFIPHAHNSISYTPPLSHHRHTPTHHMHTFYPTCTPNAAIPHVHFTKFTSHHILTPPHHIACRGVCACGVKDISTMEGDLKEMMRCMCDGSHVVWRLRLGRPTDISKQTH